MPFIDLPPQVAVECDGCGIELEYEVRLHFPKATAADDIRECDWGVVSDRVLCPDCRSGVTFEIESGVRWEDGRRVTGFSTLQFACGSIAEPPYSGIHLVRSVEGSGTPGPTLCGIDRFSKEVPGWSLGGGATGPNIDLTTCAKCVEEAGGIIIEGGDNLVAEECIGGSVGHKEARAAVAKDVAAWHAESRRLAQKRKAARDA